MNIGDPITIITDEGVDEAVVRAFKNGHVIVEVEGEGFFVYPLAEVSEV